MVITFSFIHNSVNWQNKDHLIKNKGFIVDNSKTNSKDVIVTDDVIVNATVQNYKDIIRQNDTVDVTNVYDQGETVGGSDISQKSQNTDDLFDRISDGDSIKTVVIMSIPIFMTIP